MHIKYNACHCTHYAHNRLLFVFVESIIYSLWLSLTFFISHKIHKDSIYNVRESGEKKIAGEHARGIHVTLIRTTSTVKANSCLTVWLWGTPWQPGSKHRPSLRMSSLCSQGWIFTSCNCWYDTYHMFTIAIDSCKVLNWSWFII